MSTIFTGHESEMDSHAEADAAWAEKPLAERQIDVIRSRIMGILHEFDSVGKENPFGFSPTTAEQAVEYALRNLEKAAEYAREK